MSRLANGWYAQLFFLILTACRMHLCIRAILVLTAGPVFSHYENRFFTLDVRMDIAAERLVWS